MADEEIVKYVRDSLNSGLSKETIRTSLFEAGWNEADISHAFKVCEAPNYTLPGKRHGWVQPFFAFFMIICALSAGIYFLWRDRLDLANTNSKQVRNFYSRLAASQISFTDSGEMIFPDEQKFLTKKEEYVEAKQDFIEANLKTMRLTLYHGGVAEKEIEILTKGKLGSWWETPTGNYGVIVKEVNHFSSIGKVWMPYSIQFYGNYFIHGWPHYNDGTPVQKTYSGGCIRLSDEGAKEVFDFAKKGMPILVFEDMPDRGFGTLVPRAQNAGLPAISAESFLISNVASGETIIEKNSNEKLPTASITKLMTGVVAHELIYLGSSIRVGQLSTSTTGGSSSTRAFHFNSGSYYTGFDLLYPLLMQSSNEAANVLASFSGSRLFVKSMNDKAASLNMLDTRFADPSGLSTQDVSTAKDISKLLQYIYYKRPFIFDIGRGMEFGRNGLIKIGDSISIGDLANFNEFSGETDLIGMKNGETKMAGQTMASVWNIHTPSGDVPVSIIVLNSENRYSDTKNLLNWLKSNYETL